MTDEAALESWSTTHHDLGSEGIAVLGFELTVERIKQDDAF